MNALDLLKRHEGYRRFPYLCPAGKMTIGYGWNLDDNGISEHEAEIILAGHIEGAVQFLSREPYWGGLNETRQAVLINMCVNMGWPRLSRFKKMRAALGASDFEGAADEMKDSAWYGQVGDRAKELVGMMRSGAWFPGSIRTLSGASGE